MAKSQENIQEKVEIAEPSLYNVVFLNDEVTTVEFVKLILTKYFGKTAKQADEIIDTINTENNAIVGTYYQDIAETKAQIVRDSAKANNFPFQVVVEEA